MLKTEQGREQAYFIHYQKWSKKWDEWVDNTRILKHNEENLAKQAEIKASAQVRRRETTACSVPPPGVAQRGRCTERHRSNEPRVTPPFFTVRLILNARPVFHLPLTAVSSLHCPSPLC